MNREPGPIAMSPYGSFDTMLKVVTDEIAKHSYLTGDQLTSADILWGRALSTGIEFKLVPVTKEVTDYVARIMSRPAAIKVVNDDAKRAVDHRAALASLHS